MFWVVWRSGVKQVSCKRTVVFSVSLKEGTTARAQRFYSTSKNADNRDANSSLVGNEQNKALLDRLKRGLSFGTWKFYMQDLVFKNLKPDTVPPSYKMCYRSELETYANLAITTAVSAATFMSAGLVYQLLQINPSPITEEVIGFAIVGLASVVALMNVSRRVPLRIYYSSEHDDFLVFMPRLIPFATRKLTIQPGQITPPARISGIFPWINLEHIHTKSLQKMIIDGHKFILPVYYNKLMGY